MVAVTVVEVVTTAALKVEAVKVGAARAAVEKEVGAKVGVARVAGVTEEAAKEQAVGATAAMAATWEEELESFRNSMCCSSSRWGLE